MSITPYVAFATEVAKLWNQYLKSADKRKSDAAKEAAENYMFVNKKIGKYKDITDERKGKLLEHYWKRFFHYN